MEDLRDEDDRLAGRGTAKAADSSPDSGSSGSGSGSGGGSASSEEEDARSGISGFMLDAYDRVKSHLAGKMEEEKKRTSSSSSSK